jgi:hypothetical protein
MARSVRFCFSHPINHLRQWKLAFRTAVLFTPLFFISDPSLMVQMLPLLVLLLLVNVYILFKIPAMTHSLFTGHTCGHGGGHRTAMLALRAAM